MSSRENHPGITDTDRLDFLEQFFAAQGWPEVTPNSKLPVRHVIDVEMAVALAAERTSRPETNSFGRGSTPNDVLVILDAYAAVALESLAGRAKVAE